MNMGMLVDHSDQTLAETTEYWLDAYASTKKPRTEANYRYEVTHHVLPYIGTMRIQQLQAKHIVAWHASLRTAGTSPHAIHLAHQRLQQVLDQAVTRGLVARNVANRSSRPSRNRNPSAPPGPRSRLGPSWK